ncbi:MAG: glycoside hydrolase family 3 C-terminal domain-containing protein [Clostridiales bacterium]|nr:glycoside hydrolase family 3 C-terminal domain-containing protein [Clostridiales bacterium]
MKKKLKLAIFTPIAGLLIILAIAVIVAVSIFDPSLTFLFGQSVIGEGTRSAGEALAMQIVEEGVVLVENNDNALPLDIDKDNKVAVLGWSSTQWVQGGSGSGRSTNNEKNGNLLPKTTFLGALEAAGIEYDKAITNYYSEFCSSRPFYDVGSGGGALNVHDYEYCRLIEPSVSIAKYTALLDAAVLKYDTAIVVISRISGESIDCPMVQYKNYTGAGTSPSSGGLAGASVDKERTYLDVSTEEEELLDYARANFDKVIVLINNTNAMNLGFLKDYEVDAAIIAGGTGNNSVGGLINVIYGKKILKPEGTESEEGEDEAEILISPSGRTVDTYVYDFATNPSFVYTAMDGVSQYTGLSASDKIYPFDGSTTNGNVNFTAGNEKYPGVSYLDYVEGIYVGYKWYETADAEGFWNKVNNKYGKGYNGVVQYPLGYGLSYTEFAWAINNWSVSDGKVSVTVDVTNVGNYPGQDVVQLYYTPPYNGTIEKAEVNLAAFAKTTLVLQPQKVDPDHCSQRLTLSFDVQDMASYSETEDDGAYVLEAGDYVISLRTDAHTVVPSDKISSGNATYTYKVGSKQVYNTYAGSNGFEEIRNLFLDESSDGIAIDGSDSNQEIDWLSRKNHFANFPTEKAEARAWQSVLKATNLYSSSSATAWDNAWLAANGGKVPDYGEKGNFTLANIAAENKNISHLVYDEDRSEAFTDDAFLFGNPDNYDDEDLWNALLNQMSTTEMHNLVLHGYIHEEQVVSIGKPSTRSLDGPSQVGSFNAPAYAQIGYPMTTVLAQTWNAELATAFGLAAAQQALGANVDGWYAPGANLHRSAFGGRNYEYYSEDPYLSGVMCANTVRGALNGGLYTYIKHMIGYDQESMRDGCYCWMTEQALRENYLKPFKMAIDKGASGLMSSYGRIGAVWAGGSEALLTDLLRNEWGFKGTVLTDYSDHQEFMNADQMIRAGGDLWMDGYTATAVSGYGGPGSFKQNTSSPAFTYQLRQAAKHIIYTWANAAYEADAFVKNGGDKLVIEQASIDVFKWWWLAVAGACVLFFGGAAVLLFMALRKEKKAPVAETADSGAADKGAQPTLDADTAQADSSAEPASNDSADPPTESEKKICKNCGAENKDESTFCRECGSKME